MQFVDECTLTLKAGNGGNGVVSWRREAHYPEGGPWGGDGGNGGSIIIIGDHNINTLFDLRNKKNIFAENGENGQTKMATGKQGEDCYIKVPLGTSIYDAYSKELIVDILKSGQTYTICNGGKGGHGNAFFKSSFNKAPTLFENGDLGEERKIDLKLRYVADVGIIGFPNAGKSTLVSALSNARPRIANYQFTTLVPVLGTVSIKDKNLVFADIPGLIEGASEGKGLGHDFLKHIERCQMLIHLISLSEIDNDDLFQAYSTINDELSKFNNKLTKKKILVVLNKSDMCSDESIVKDFCNKAKLKDVLVISAKDKLNLDKLLHQVYKIYIEQEAKNQKALDTRVSDTEVIELKKQKDYKQDLKITMIDDHIWQVESEFLKYWSYKIPLTTKDNIIRFNQKMLSIDVENKAKQLGAIKGDTLKIYDLEFVVE